MDFINLTPHTVTIEKENGERISFPPSGKVARVSVNQIVSHDINGIQVVENVYCDIEGLPDHKENPNAVYIVSSLVGAAKPASWGRYDLLGPDSGPTAIRDEKNQIVAVRRFVQF